MPKRQQLCPNLVSNLVTQEQSGRPGAIWSARSNLVGQERSGYGGDLVTNLVTLEQSGRPEAIWSLRSNLVAHQVAGASGRQSGRGRCIQL